MLTTQQEHELPTFPFAAGANVTTWRAVTLHLGTPYVFVHYAIRDKRIWVSQTTVFWREEDALSFLRALNEDGNRKVLSVFILVLIVDEHSERWTYVPIQEVLVRKFEDGEPEDDLPIFVTNDGNIFSSRFSSVEDARTHDTLKTLDRVFMAN